MMYVILSLSYSQLPTIIIDDRYHLDQPNISRMFCIFLVSISTLSHVSKYHRSTISTIWPASRLRVIKKSRYTLKTLRESQK